MAIQVLAHFRHHPSFVSSYAGSVEVCVCVFVLCERSGIYSSPPAGGAGLECFRLNRRLTGVLLMKSL